MKRKMILRVVLILIGAAGVLDTLVISRISSLNLGVLLPGILGLPLLAIGLFWAKLEPLAGVGWLRVVKIVLVAGYALAFVLFAVTWGIIDSAANDEVPEELDVVIVLGAAVRGDRPTRVLRERLDTAIAYLRAYPDTVAILSGGQGDGENISEAEAMARYLAERGIPEQRYMLEQSSASTEQNFAYSYEMIQARWGADVSIGFVTTNFHVYRAERVARKQGIKAEGIAAPDSWYIVLNNHLRECVAIWGYLLRGSI